MGHTWSVAVSSTELQQKQGIFIIIVIIYLFIKKQLHKNMTTNNT